MVFLITVASNAIALWVTTLMLSGIRLEAAGGEALASGASTGEVILYFLLAGAVLAMINLFVRPIVNVLSLPFYVLTLGLFFFVVNALMLQLTAWITSHFQMSLVIDGFGWALLGGIVVGLVNWLINLAVNME